MTCITRRPEADIFKLRVCRCTGVHAYLSACVHRVHATVEVRAPVPSCAEDLIWRCSCTLLCWGVTHRQSRCPALQGASPSIMLTGRGLLFEGMSVSPTCTAPCASGEGLQLSQSLSRSLSFFLSAGLWEGEVSPPARAQAPPTVAGA